MSLNYQHNFFEETAKQNPKRIFIGVKSNISEKLNQRNGTKNLKS